jgi:regulator of cell morphogenesis and NO signaling
MGAAELVDHLEATHHRYLHEELPRLSALVAKIVSVHGEHHPELSDIATCYEEIRADLEPHLMKEERVLFPMIRELAVATTATSFHCGTLRNPISVMLSEHDAVGDLLARLHRLTAGYVTPADGCASYVACFAGLAELEADTHLHIHKENNLLFPLVERLEGELAAAT